MDAPDGSVGVKGRAGADAFKYPPGPKGRPGNMGEVGAIGQAGRDAYDGLRGGPGSQVRN